MVNARGSIVVALCALACSVVYCAAACSSFDAVYEAPPGEAGSDVTTAEIESGADGSRGRDDSGVDADLPDAPAAAGPLIVFATAMPATGALLGASAADALCSGAAHAAGFPTSTSFVAWLSTSSKSAPARLNGAGPWHVPQANVAPGRYLPGNLVAATKAQLVSGALAGPINRNENGDVIGQIVWTGTAADGGATPYRCADWTSAASNDLATVGSSDQSDANWTRSTILGCSNSLAIYCFQVP